MDLVRILVIIICILIVVLFTTFRVIRYLRGGFSGGHYEYGANSESSLLWGVLFVFVVGILHFSLSDKYKITDILNWREHIEKDAKIETNEKVDSLVYTTTKASNTEKSNITLVDKEIFGETLPNVIGDERVNVKSIVTINYPFETATDDEDFYFIQEGIFNNPDYEEAAFNRLKGDSRFHLKLGSYQGGGVRIGYGPFKNNQDAILFKETFQISGFIELYRWS